MMTIFHQKPPISSSTPSTEAACDDFPAFGIRCWCISIDPSRIRASSSYPRKDNQLPDQDYTWNITIEITVDQLLSSVLFYLFHCLLTSAGRTRRRREKLQSRSSRNHRRMGA